MLPGKGKNQHVQPVYRKPDCDSAKRIVPYLFGRLDLNVLRSVVDNSLIRWAGKQPNATKKGPHNVSTTWRKSALRSTRASPRTIIILTNIQVPLSEIPAGKPPSGVTPNFHSNSSLAPAITTVSVIMMIWAVSFVVLRVYANLRAPRGLGLDDCKACFVYLNHTDS